FRTIVRTTGRLYLYHYPFSLLTFLFHSLSLLLTESSPLLSKPNSLLALLAEFDTILRRDLRRFSRVAVVRRSRGSCYGSVAAALVADLFQSLPPLLLLF
ncbi:hypothetical protein GIB67_034599, partial [Kingdonia uniflora]